MENIINNYSSCFKCKQRSLLLIFNETFYILINLSKDCLWLVFTDQEKLERLHQIFNTKPKEEKIEGTKTGVKQSGLLSPKIVKAILPKFISSSKSSEEKELQKKIAKMVKKPKNAVHFMRGIMDECTHLKNFSVPIDTSLIVAVCAQADGYVPREGCSSLEEVWPGATVHYLNAGHVSAYILYRKFFR